jgi:hypothetical protein
MQMTRLLTKADREQSREAQFSRLIAAGFVRETYKKLDFFIRPTEKGFDLKVFSGTSSNHIGYSSYSTPHAIDAAINTYKKNHDRTEAWKAERKANKTLSTAANASAAIKSELKGLYPGIAFSVRSDNFAGGNSVHVSWVDGPTTREVDAHIGKYQYGHFDGMTDMYENTNCRDDIPQAKYVQVSRTQSEGVKALTASLDQLTNGWDRSDWSSQPEQLLYRIFCKVSIPAGAFDFRIERSGVDAGLAEDFFLIRFSAPAVEEKPVVTRVSVEAGTVQVIQYGRGIAVVGDTKPIKDKLGRDGLGGKFNPHLTVGPGWVFPMEKLEAVKAALTL